MKLTKKATYIISFQVEAFWNEEGGMGSSTFGPTTNTLEDAIHQLELARSTDQVDKSTYGDTPWVIVCYVTTEVKGI